MKKHILIITIAFVGMMLSSCDFEAYSKTIEGNGNIVTRTYDVSDFNGISAALPAKVNYTVSENYSCIVRVDENLLEYLDIKVKDNDLLLGRLKEHNNTNLKATEFVIEVTAPSLEEINLAGSGEFNALSPMEGEKLEVNLAGSGDVFFKEKVAVGELEMSVAGSGSIDCKEIVADKLDTNLAGSGDVKVAGGTVREAEAGVAGSGDVVLYCDIETLEADIAGSGDIKARVSGKLKYGIIGSGDIGYYGNPIVEGDKSGRGKLTRLGD